MKARLMLHRTLFCGLWLALALAAWLPDALAQPKNCPEQLADANEHYAVGRFDVAIELLTQCLGTETSTPVERQKAYRLLGLSYMGKELAEEARKSVQKLLELVPNYQTDPVQDPPPFIRLVEEVRAEMQEEAPVVEEPPIVVRPEEEREPPPPPPIVQPPPRKKGGIPRWLLIGGGVVAGGVVAAVLLSGDKGPSSLPGPPPLPGGN